MVGAADGLQLMQGRLASARDSSGSETLYGLRWAEYTDPPRATEGKESDPVNESGAKGATASSVRL